MNLEQKEEFTLLALLGYLAIAVGLFFYSLLVFTKVWSYIAIPIMGAHAINMWQAWGLMLLFNFYTSETSNEEKPNFKHKLISRFSSVSAIWAVSYLFFG